jgi:hypothetical protein
MRAFIFIPLLLLTSCAQLTPRALSGQTAVEKLRTDLGADIDLRLALQKDIARKNAELSYISYNRYPCGPDNLEFAKYRIYDFTPPKPKMRDDRVAARIKFLLAQYSDLKVILDYGDALNAAIKDQATYAKRVTSLQGLVDSYKGFVPSEFAAALKLMRDAIGFAGFGINQILQAKIIDIAITAEDGLKKSRQRMVDQGVFKALTQEESKLFRAWDVCAIDRLSFLRAYNPSSPPSYLWKGDADKATLLTRTAGENRSSVLDFAVAYRTYLDEKQAFVGQRQDYLSDVDQIIAKNSQIAHLDKNASFDDILAALTDIGTTAGQGKTQLDTLKADLRAAGLNI